MVNFESQTPKEKPAASPEAAAIEVPQEIQEMTGDVANNLNTLLEKIKNLPAEVLEKLSLKPSFTTFMKFVVPAMLTLGTIAGSADDAQAQSHGISNTYQKYYGGGARSGHRQGGMTGAQKANMTGNMAQMTGGIIQNVARTMPDREKAQKVNLAGYIVTTAGRETSRVSSMVDLIQRRNNR